MGMVEDIDKAHEQLNAHLDDIDLGQFEHCGVSEQILKTVHLGSAQRLSIIYAGSDTIESATFHHNGVEIALDEDEIERLSTEF